MLTISREARGSGWLINGLMHNTDTSEQYKFFAEEKQGLGIRGKFGVDVKNLHDDLYRGIELRGRVEGGMLSICTACGRNIVSPETVIGPVYSDWSLMFSLPEGKFDLLEHLESFYPGQRIQFMELYDFGGKLLYGYAMFGYGQPMSYWWCDENRQVVLVSQTLLTYALCEVEYGGGAE